MYYPYSYASKAPISYLAISLHIPYPNSYASIVHKIQTSKKSIFEIKAETWKLVVLSNLQVS